MILHHPIYKLEIILYSSKNKMGIIVHPSLFGVNLESIWYPFDYPDNFATLQPHYHEKPLMRFRPYGVLFLNILCLLNLNLKKDFFAGCAVVTGLFDV